MARSIEPDCRQCRREGCKLFLKGERCTTKEMCHGKASGYSWPTWQFYAEELLSLNTAHNFAKNKKSKESMAC